MNPVIAMKRQRAALRAETLEFLAGVDDKKGLTAEQRKRLDTFSLDSARLEAEISAEEERREAVRNQPELAGGTFDLTDRIPKGWPDGDKPASRDPHYAAMFGLKSLASDGWDSFEEYLGAIHSGLRDPRVMAASSMGGSIGSEGGFFVPEQFSAGLLDGSLEAEIVRPRATVYPMTSETRKIAGFQDNDHSGGTVNGLVGRWMGEDATNTDQKAKTRLLELHAHKLAIFASASNELVADGMTFEDLLGGAMTDSMGFNLDRAFFTGNGVAKPLGIFNDQATVAVPKEVGQDADTILYENLTKMFSRMYGAGVGRSVWVANQSTIPQLLTLTVPVGSGGSVIPVLTQIGGGFQILTRPVIFTEKVPTLGDVGDISLIDFTQYGIGLRREVVLDKSQGPGWHEDESSYRTILRVDGRGTWSASLVPANGAGTLSWAVTLAARA